MLTTTLDGLWALQVFTGIEVLCPELGLRPFFPRAEDARLALGYPVVRELTDSGAVAIGHDGPIVDGPITEWLTVISRREVALMVLLNEPGDSKELPTRVALSRFGRWWVSAARFGGETVRVRPMGVATCAADAAQLIGNEITALCGANDAAAFRPLTVQTAELLKSASRGGLQRLLISDGAGADQLRAVSALADANKSAQASIVGLQTGAKAPAVTDHVVTIGDTTAGRIMVTNTVSGGQTWTQIAPGSARAITAGIVALLAQLPARDEWFAVRNAFG